MNENRSFDQNEPIGAFPTDQTGAYLQDFKKDFSSADITITATGGSSAALKVLSTTPISGATEVAQNSAISVTFNNSIDTASLNDTSVYLDYIFQTTAPPLETTSRHLPGTISWSGDQKTIYFNPDGENLLKSLQYSLHCTTGIKDTGGGTLDAEKVVSFTIEDNALGASDLNTNWDFASGLELYRPHMGWSSVDLGQMSVYWETNGTDKYAVVKRANTSDGGRVMVAKKFDTNFFLAYGYQVEVMVTYRRVAQTLAGEQFTVLVWYGPSTGTGFENVAELYMTDFGDTDSDWVINTQILPCYDTTGFFIGQIAVGSGGWSYTTHIKDISITIGSAPM